MTVPEISCFAACLKTDWLANLKSVKPGDGLALRNIFISAVCRCAPPQNKPNPSEIKNCVYYLEEEVDLLSNLKVIIALGRLAFDQVLALVTRRTGIQQNYPFQHGNCYELCDTTFHLVASYHPSRQNTQTGRLTEAMFDNIWVSANKLLDRAS